MAQVRTLGTLRKEILTGQWGKKVDTLSITITHEIEKGLLVF